jgi:hypothetical protein
LTINSFKFVIYLEEVESRGLKREIGAFTDMQKWVLCTPRRNRNFYKFSYDIPLVNLADPYAF